MTLGIAEILTVSGLLMDIAGVFLLFRADFLEMRRDLAELDLPEDHLAKNFESAVKGEPVRHETWAESTYDKRTRDIDPTVRRKFMIWGGTLLIAGFLFQILGAITPERSEQGGGGQAATRSESK